MIVYCCFHSINFYISVFQILMRILQRISNIKASFCSDTGKKFTCMAMKQKETTYLSLNPAMNCLSGWISEKTLIQTTKYSNSRNFISYLMWKGNEKKNKFLIKTILVKTFGNNIIEIGKTQRVFQTFCCFISGWHFQWYLYSPELLFYSK